MTPMRKLALKISHFVVRHASPGSKEWAQGLAAEVAFIENDWSALAWAFGSTKVLLDYREIPVASLADVPTAAQKFVESIRASGAALCTVILQGPFYAWEFFHTAWWLERAGCVVAMLSSIAAGIFLLMERRRLKNLPDVRICVDLEACARFYRAELGRRCSTLWIQISTVFGWAVGGTLAAGGGLYFHAVFGLGIVLLALMAAPFFINAQRTNRRRIERLDAFLAERS